MFGDFNSILNYIEKQLTNGQNEIKYSYDLVNCLFRSNSISNIFKLIFELNYLETNCPAWIE